MFRRLQKIVQVVVKVCTLYLLCFPIQIVLINVHYIYIYVVLVVTSNKFLEGSTIYYLDRNISLQLQ
jgi:hypothetical protein